MIRNKKKLPLVVIFGRTNVGKSTLFNKLTEQNKALISDTEGTTRDSNIGEVAWRRKKFSLIDTGGIMNIKNLLKKPKKADLSAVVPLSGTKADDIDTIVQKQARDYLKKADLILFLVDTKVGLLPDDKKMALILKKTFPKNKNIMLIANKADSPRLRSQIAEFNKLSLGEPIPVSATTGSGTGDLLDLIVKKIKSKKIEDEIEKRETINVCILGQPNVGKSSLVNSILGEKRIIVSPIPHTTREPQDTEIEYNDNLFNLIDTAGISKKGQKGAKKIKHRETLEKKSITKSLKVLKNADIALLIIDIKKGITHQDAKLVDEIISHRVSLIIIANKWDLIKERDTKKYTQYIYNSLPFVKWAPIQFLSALTGEKVMKVLDLVLEIKEQRKIKITDTSLKNFLSRIVRTKKPPRRKQDKRPHIFELKQTKIDPPKFFIRVRNKDDMPYSYIKFIENRMRGKFGFIGTPINIAIIKKSIIKEK